MDVCESFDSCPPTETAMNPARRFRLSRRGTAPFPRLEVVDPPRRNLTLCRANGPSPRARGCSGEFGRRNQRTFRFPTRRRAGFRVRESFRGPRSLSAGSIPHFRAIRSRCPAPWPFVEVGASRAEVNRPTTRPCRHHPTQQLKRYAVGVSSA